LDQEAESHAKIPMLTWPNLSVITGGLQGIADAATARLLLATTHPYASSIAEPPREDHRRAYFEVDVTSASPSTRTSETREEKSRHGTDIRLMVQSAGSRPSSRIFNRLHADLETDALKSTSPRRLPPPSETAALAHE